MDKHDEQQPRADEPHEQQPKVKEGVEDLDVPAEESDQVKGGLNFSKIEYDYKPQRD